MVKVIKAGIVFHDCLQYRNGYPGDEGFYSYGQSRFKKYDVKWGEFYRVYNSNWKGSFQPLLWLAKQKPKEVTTYFILRTKRLNVLRNPILWK